MRDTLVEGLAWLAALLLALSAHEAAHAAAALKLGDPTARDRGRLTLLPFAHLDWWGSLLLPGLLLALGGPPLGYAKPTPVDPARLRRPQRDFSLVALAGPLANLGLALGLGLAGRLLFGSLGLESQAARGLLRAGVAVNALLAWLNLLPLPGFDGLKALYALLPERWCWKLQRVDAWLFPLLLLAAAGGLFPWILAPADSLARALARW